jgi:hypothetical protein
MLLLLLLLLLAAGLPAGLSHTCLRFLLLRLASVSSYKAPQQQH